MKKVGGYGGVGGMRGGGGRGEGQEQRSEVCLYLRGLQAKVFLADYASFPEDWTILVLVLKVCDSKALVFPKCKALKSGNLTLESRI